MKCHVCKKREAIVINGKQGSKCSICAVKALYDFVYGPDAHVEKKPKKKANAS